MLRALDRDTLGRLTLLGEGGQGRVYRCETTPLLFKEYVTPTAVRIPSLAALIEAADAMRPADRLTVDRLSAFPQQLVHADGKLAGFLMPEAPASFWGQVGSQRKLLELQFLTHPKRPVWANLQIPDDHWKTRFLVAVANLFDTLHRNGLVVGDVSMRNLLWSPEADPSAFLIDCDSMRILGSEPAVPPAYTPDWDDPADPLGTTLDSDRYKLALIILRVLTVQPTARPTGLEYVIPEPVRDLLRETGQARPGERPAAARWLEALEGRTRIALLPLDRRQRPTSIEAAARPQIGLPPRPAD